MFSSIVGNPFADKHTKLQIDGKVVKNLFTHGLEALPNEYSALLAGHDSTIVSFLSGQAVEGGLHTFAWSGPTLISALKQMQDQGLTWLGVLHTHPRTPPVPSSADLDEWHYPTLSYWVLSYSSHFTSPEPQLSLYQWMDGRFEKKEYVIL